MKPKIIIKPPEGLERSEHDISNFEYPGEIEDGADENLKTGKYVVQHSAWSFCGWIWYDANEKKYYEQIMVYHDHVGTLSADSLEKLVESACEKYGTQ